MLFESLIGFLLVSLAAVFVFVPLYINEDGSKKKTPQVPTTPGFYTMFFLGIFFWYAIVNILLKKRLMNNLSLHIGRDSFVTLGVGVIFVLLSIAIPNAHNGDATRLGYPPQNNGYLTMFILGIIMITQGSSEFFMSRLLRPKHSRLMAKLFKILKENPRLISLKSILHNR